MNTSSIETLSQAASQLAGEALRALSKAFRSRQLYLPNNPARNQSLDLAREAFTRLWAEADKLVLEVRESSFSCAGDVVFQDRERASDSLPWLLYRDGVRSFTFMDGCEAAELEELLDMLQRVRGSESEDDDIVTLLWVADFARMSYRHVDVSEGGDDWSEQESTSAGNGAAAGVVSMSPGEPSLAVPDAESATPSPEQTREASPGLIRPDDFDSTLYFLDQRETTYLQEELRREYSEDQRRLVLASLFDTLELQVEPAVQKEVLDLLDQLVLEFLASGHYDLVAYILREAARLVDSSSVVPDTARALTRLPERMSEPAAVGQLLAAVDNNVRAPVTSLLEVLFGELRVAALEPLMTWLGTSSASPIRASVEKASLRLAGAHTAEVARLLESENDVVVSGALRLVGQLQTAAVVPALAKVLKTGPARLRAEAVGVLSSIGSPGALQALERAVDDEDREVRVAGYRAIRASRYSAALPRLADQLRRKDTRNADLGEKMALFEAFGSLCGDAGVRDLDSLLNSRGLLGARENAEIRACAARALGMIGTGMAMSALQRASDTRDVVVRNAVARAMRGE